MFPVEIVIAYLALGVVAGTAAGLLGIGGGLIIVPVLSWVFLQQGFSGAAVLHLAIGTSLSTIVLTSVSSVLAHQCHGAILWPVVMRLVPGILVGAFASGFIAEGLSKSVLGAFFGVFEVCVALQMWWQLKPAAHKVMPTLLGLVPIGGVLGWCLGCLVLVEEP
jgi:uncharacterized protein